MTKKQIIEAIIKTYAKHGYSRAVNECQHLIPDKKVMYIKEVEYLKPDDLKVLTIDDIVSVVCEVMKLKKDDVISKSRREDLKMARAFIFIFARTFTPITLAKLGRDIGGRNHSTVLSSLRAFDHIHKTDEYNEIYNEIFNTLYEVIRIRGSI